MPKRGAIYNPVLHSVLASNGKPFNLLGLARATKLTPNQAYGVLARMLEAGLVKRIGEKREKAGSGRGGRVYALADIATAGADDTLLAKIKTIVVSLAGANEFSTVDVVTRLGKRESGWPMYSASSVKLVLEMLEMQGVVVRVAEYIIQRGRGRPSQRWTSNPSNMQTQQRLLELARQHR